MSRDVLDLLTAANPNPATASMPDEVWPSDVLRNVIDQRRTGGEVDPRVSRRDILNRRIPRPVLAVAAGVAIVILVVGLPLFLGWRNTDEPVVTVTTVPSNSTSVGSTPSTAPPDVLADSGTIQTPLGEVAWQHLTGDSSSLPNRRPLVTPSGFIAISVDNTATDNGQFDDPSFFRSTDGHEWTVEPLPVTAVGPSAALHEIAGEFWLTTADYPTAANLWRSEDGESWSEIPLPDGVDLSFTLLDVADATWLTDVTGRIWVLDGSSWAELDVGQLGPSAITGLDSYTSIQTPATLGDVTLIPWSLSGLGINYSEWLGVGEIGSPQYDPDTAVLVIPSQSTGEPLATLSVSAKGNRIAFTDESGTVIHEIVVNDERIDAATLKGLRTFDQFVMSGLGVLDGSGRSVESSPPWMVPIEPSWPAQVVAFDGRFFAFVTHAKYEDPGLIGPTDIEVELWTSTDGLNWEGPSSFLPEGAHYMLHASVENDLLLADIGVGGGGTEFWISENGLDWTPTGLVDEWPVTVGGGGLAGGYGGIHASSDLRSWEAVDTGELGFDAANANSVDMTEAGGLIFLTVEQGDVATDIWVLQPGG